MEAGTHSKIPPPVTQTKLGHGLATTNKPNLDPTNLTPCTTSALAMGHPLRTEGYRIHPAAHRAC